MNDEDIVITGIARTPMGGFQGALTGASAPELGAAAIKLPRWNAAVLQGDDIDEVIMGCVLPAGPRTGAGAPGERSVPDCRSTTGCTTVNKMCGSGMKAARCWPHDLLKAGSNRVMLAGGLESMS